jgi:hypothetical protein
MPIDWDKIKSAAGTPTTPSTPSTPTTKTTPTTPTIDWDRIDKAGEEYKRTHAARKDF